MAVTVLATGLTGGVGQRPVAARSAVQGSASLGSGALVIGVVSRILGTVVRLSKLGA